jgi:hypothetical protein
VLRGGVKPFRAAGGFHGIREKVAGTLAGGVELGDRLIQVHADPAGTSAARLQRRIEGWRVCDRRTGPAVSQITGR